MGANTLRYVFKTDSVSWDKNKQIVSGISVSVDTSTILGIVGPSGCGKSTLLNAFTGRDKRVISQCSRKKILDDEKEVSLSLNDCVLMPQDSQDGLLPWYDVKKYLRLVGVDKQRLTQSYLTQLVSEVGLEPSVLSTRPFNLSGGQKRRVLLLATLLTQCDVIFLDEPFVGLDLDVRKKAIEFLRSAISAECNEAYRCGAAIMVSHSIEDVAMLCDKVAVAKIDNDKRLIFEILDFSLIETEKEHKQLDELSWREKLIRRAFGYE